MRFMAFIELLDMDFTLVLVCIQEAREFMHLVYRQACISPTHPWEELSLKW